MTLKYFEVGDYAVHDYSWSAKFPCVSLEPVGVRALKFIMHGQCDARPTVTFSSTGARLYCLEIMAHGFENISRVTVQVCCG